ncbi:hypothetical protein L1887_11700 [Cichorium endivia]|nr:hypothetical protein L1887_11700 [Cichorium endivia]
MVFGKKVSDQNSRESRERILVDEDEDSTQENTFVEETQEVQSQQVKDDKPLLHEVNFIATAASKNAGGSKVWVCKHCKQQFTSSYTRIHAHFFGGQGRKAEIKRCPVVQNDREKYEMLLKKVKDAEKVGVSRSLKNSIITKKQSFSSSSSKKPIEEAFGALERSIVDLKIMRGLCANGIPFNVLRNPQFLEMVTAINRAPAGSRVPNRGL